MFARRIAALVLSAAAPLFAHAEPATLRIATFNVEDVRTEHLAGPDDPKLRELAAIIQSIRPDILFLNEIQFDTPEGANARRFADLYLAVPQTLDGQPQPPLRMTAFAAPSNTGVHSGLDLDRNGRVDPNPGARDFAGDCWGYGQFSGHYAMALFVREGLTIDSDAARTFQRFRWADMPGALLPVVPESNEAWLAPEAARGFPLSSKSHWDIPVRTPDGATIHILASHPTPPVFDGPEDRNGRRNHDEIRFWGEFLAGADWIVDDRGRRGGLAPDAHFVIVGDLNADPRGGDSLDNPVGRWLLQNPRLGPDPAPSSETMMPKLDPLDTARFGLRVDYALPAATLSVVSSGMRRSEGPSDHFPVWIDIQVPAKP